MGNHKKTPGRMTNLEEPKSLQDARLAQAIFHGIGNREGLDIDDTAREHGVEPSMIEALLASLKEEGHKLEPLDMGRGRVWRSAGLFSTARAAPKYPKLAEVLRALEADPSLDAEWTRLVTSAGRLLSRKKTGAPLNPKELELVTGLEKALKPEKIERAIKLANCFGTPPGWQPFESLNWKNVPLDTPGHFFNNMDPEEIDDPVAREQVIERRGNKVRVKPGDDGDEMPMGEFLRSLFSSSPAPEAKKRKPVNPSKREEDDERRPPGMSRARHLEIKTNYLALLGGALMEKQKRGVKLDEFERMIVADLKALGPDALELAERYVEMNKHLPPELRDMTHLNPHTKEGRAYGEFLRKTYGPKKRGKR